MAQKKAVLDSRQKKCEEEAKQEVYNWFSRNNIGIPHGDIYAVWFAFSQNGYRTMLTSRTYSNNFFEIVRNVKTNELVMHCFNRFECSVNPSKIKKAKHMDIAIPLV